MEDLGIALSRAETCDFPNGKLGRAIFGRWGLRSRAPFNFVFVIVHNQSASNFCTQIDSYGLNFDWQIRTKYSH